MAEQTVRLEARDNGVRLLTLDDPSRHNAISLRMRDELLAAADAVRSDPDARALVVTGAGRSFCSGADLAELLGGSPPVGVLRDRLSGVYQGFLTLRDLEIPTIAAVRGHAVGAGLNLAMCCDLRVAAPDTRFSATFSRIGLHPGGGATYFLVRALGRERALALLLSGGTVTGEEAVRQGLALAVHEDPLAEALAMADRFAALPTALARDIKRAVALTDHGLEATLSFESWAQASTGTLPEVLTAATRRR
ncbi:enoyl-CoA hydratase [Actinocorallia herbida]|uniref:Enoyl-CoA hydratase n=1 Tax=Actinocorallia herbida TaxID=58109 RepID=A0A3N1D395_9ACTN|nr:enoyl-CoA hydratase-related protein [Actinocorallia herbida]ROO88013.1 enoyl-CoA hydratase [Actinocorallia herbida]